MIRTHNARLGVLAAVLTFGAVPAAQAQFGLVSESQELQAGREADAQIRQKYRVSSDPTLNRMVQTIGRRLASVSERPNIPWTFRVLDSNELNAFSVPGYVYMTTATIQAAGRDQDMIAGVFAHEIGHTTGKHAVKQMEKGAIGSLLVGLLGGKNKTISGLAGVAANLVMLGYSRDDENDSDKRAVRYMMKAGYDPNGLARFFELLQSRGDRGGTGLASYFRTHPPTGDRVKRVREEIAKNGGSSGNFAHRSYLRDDPNYDSGRRRRDDLRSDGTYRYERRRRQVDPYRDPYDWDR